MILDDIAKDKKGKGKGKVVLEKPRRSSRSTANINYLEPGDESPGPSKGNKKKEKNKSKKKDDDKKGFFYLLTLDDPSNPRKSSNTTKIKWELKHRHNMSALPLGDWRKFMAPFFLRHQADRLLLECIEENNFLSNDIRVKVNKLLRDFFDKMNVGDLQADNLNLQSFTSKTLGKKRLFSLIQNFAEFTNNNHKSFNESTIKQLIVRELTGNLKSLAINNLKRVLTIRIARQLKSRYSSLNVRWGVFRGFAQQICTYILGRRGKLASEKHEDEHEEEDEIEIEEEQDEDDVDIMTLTEFRTRLDKKAKKMKVKTGGETTLKNIIKRLTDEQLNSYLPNYLVPLTRGNGWGAMLSGDGYKNIGLAWALFHEVNGEAIEDQTHFVQHLFPTPNVL